MDFDSNNSLNSNNIINDNKIFKIDLSFEIEIDTTPVYFKYCGEKNTVDSWADCFKKICELLITDFPGKIRELTSDTIFFEKNELVRSSFNQILRKPLKIGDGSFFIENDLPQQDYIKALTKLFKNLPIQEYELQVFCKKELEENKLPKIISITDYPKEDFSWTLEELCYLFSLFNDSKKKILSERRKDFKKASVLLRSFVERKGLTISTEYRSSDEIETKYQNFLYITTNGLAGVSDDSELLTKVENLYNNSPNEFNSISYTMKLLLEDKIQKQNEDIKEYTNEELSNKDTTSAIYETNNCDLKNDKTNSKVSKRPPKWDKEEAILLVDAYINMKKNNISYLAAADELSKTLRKKAILKGMKIDDAYRNQNGMKMQLQYVNYLDTGKGLLNGSSIVKEVYNYYKVQPEEFASISKLIKETIYGKKSTPNGNMIISESEVSYTASGKKEFNLNVVNKNSSENNNLMTENEFIVDFNNLNFSYESTKPLSFIYKDKKEDCVSWASCYIQILKLLIKDNLEEFINLCNKPLPFASRIDFCTYENIYKLRSFAEVNQEKVLYAETDLSAKDFIRRLCYLLNTFNLSYDILKIKCIRNIIQDSTQNKQTIKVTPLSNSYYRPSYEPSTTYSIDKELEKVLKDAGVQGMSVEQIASKINYGVQAVIFHLNNSSFAIPLKQNWYKHASFIPDLKEMASNLKAAVEAGFNRFYGYSNSSLILSAARTDLDLDMFLGDNGFDNPKDAWCLARYAVNQILKIPYIFKDGSIWKEQPEFGTNYMGICLSYIKQNGGSATADELNDYAQEIQIELKPTPAAVLKIPTSTDVLMYQEETFVLSEKVFGNSKERESFIKDADKAISRIFESGNDFATFTLLDELSFYSYLPETFDSSEWTPYLLQEYIKKFSNKFKLINLYESQNYNELRPAFVPVQSGITDFSILLYYALNMNIKNKKITLELPFNANTQELLGLLFTLGFINKERFESLSSPARKNGVTKMLQKALPQSKYFSWSLKGDTLRIVGGQN